jgi:hypothetical protein
MAKYLLLYLSSEAPQDQMQQSTPEQMQEEIQKWESWGAEVGERMVDFGNPTADNDGIGGSYVGGYSIVSADTAEDLAELLDGHPHLPFGTIHTVEVTPIPGM